MLLSAVSYNECTVGLPHGCCWVRHQNGWCRKYYSTLLPGHNACREEPFSYGWFSLLWDTTTKRDNALKSGVIFILWCKDSKDTEVQVTEQYHTTNKANTINTSIILINMTTPHKYWNSEATPSSLTLRQETKCTSFHFTSLFPTEMSSCHSWICPCDASVRRSTGSLRWLCRHIWITGTCIHVKCQTLLQFSPAIMTKGQLVVCRSSSEQQSLF